MTLGLGKTYLGAEKLINLKNNVNLVICQKSKMEDWLNHFKTHYINYSVFDLTDKKQFLDYIKQYSKSPKQIGVINYDLVWRRKELLKLNNFTLMLDESSLIQNEKAKRSKFIMKLNFENVILLSGTPTDGKYERLWTQAKLLGWDISKDVFLRTYVNFKVIEVKGFHHKIVDPDNPYKNVERLKRKFREHGAIFMKTEEVIELPKQTFIKEKVQKTKEYTKFKNHSYVIVDDEELVGETLFSKMLRLRQLCGQYNKHKLQAFKDLVESTSDRLIVFYNFNNELHKMKKIAAELGRPISEVNGSTKDLSSYENETNSITFVQYQAGAMGINLQKANKIVYFTLPLKSEYFEQSKKRIHRVGQEKPCFYYLLLCEGTIEEDIERTLDKRKDFTDELFKEKFTGNSD